MQPAPILLCAAACLFLAGCVVVQRSSVEEISPAPDRVESPIRVFLSDGSVVVFEPGALVTADSVSGVGERYDLFRERAGAATQVPMDSVLGVEALHEWTDTGLTLVASTLATAAVIGVPIALICAADPKCFGSCPTIYTQTGDGALLEAEAFSYSISPLLEGRDLDRLHVQASPEGLVQLEVRNEALETHFINHLELVEVRHAPDEVVLPDPQHRTIAVGPSHPFSQVTDRDGRDVTHSVQARDSAFFGTSQARIRGATAHDSRDWIEATVPPTGADTVAITLRLRNSLLNTVLFYEFMLDRQGVGSLDWMAMDVERIGAAVELGSWFHDVMGLRVQVEGTDGFEEVARVGDTGPIAWKDVVVRVPTHPNRPTTVRLAFLADEWRIDHLAWSSHSRVAELREIEPTRVSPLSAALDDDLLSRIVEADDDYLVTSAGTAFTVDFEAGPLEAGQARTFLLGSQGYYSEWVRPIWMKPAHQSTAFVPTNEMLPDLMERWLEVREPMERAFHSTRIPVGGP